MENYFPIYVNYSRNVGINNWTWHTNEYWVYVCVTLVCLWWLRAKGSWYTTLCACVCAE